MFAGFRGIIGDTVAEDSRLLLVMECTVHGLLGFFEACTQDIA